MSFVLDASVALAWMLREARAETAARVLAAMSAEVAHVPVTWPFEMANGLLMATRARRMTSDEFVDGLQAVADLQVQVDAGSAATACGPVAVLARQHGLTAYDAAYLELALRLDVPLATQDGELARAARASGARLF